jgi:sulfur-oxidizing protein SoxY
MSPSDEQVMKRRRIVIAAGLGCLLAPAAQATPEALRAAVQAFTGGRTPRTGRVLLDIAPLIDNGNVVPVTIRVQSPMSAADHVRRIALFTELNPLPEVAVFHLGPLSGRAQVSTRIRLATTQTLTALAEMNDGGLWQQKVDVIVTLAACIE